MSNENRDVLIHETASSYSDDTSLMKMYYDMNDISEYKKKAKTLKIVGWTVGPVLFSAGVLWLWYGAYCDEFPLYGSLGAVVMAGGIGTTVGCLVKSNQYMK